MRVRRAAPTGDPLATAEPDDEADDAGTAAEPAPPMPECDVRCCSDEMLRAQKRAAQRMGDPSVAHECCFCEEGE